LIITHNHQDQKGHHEQDREYRLCRRWPGIVAIDIQPENPCNETKKDESDQQRNNKAGHPEQQGVDISLLHPGNVMAGILPRQEGILNQRQPRSNP
jgi:hypothetical protein